MMDNSKPETIEKVVGLVKFGDQVIMATDLAVYELIDNKFKAIEVEWVSTGAPVLANSGALKDL